MSIGKQIKRSIRLKEAMPLSDRMIPVPSGYIADDSISHGPFRARADKDGFLITGNEVNEDDIPLVFLGGSFVESMLIPENRRFVAEIERQLDGFSCLNGGYSGSSTLHLFNVLLNKVYPLVGQTGAVVFFVGQSDADSIGLPDSYWNMKIRATPIQPAAVHTRSPMVTHIEAVAALTNLVVDACERLGMKLILGVGPYRVASFGTDRVLRRLYKRNSESFERSRGFRNAIAETARAVARERGIELLDAQALTGGAPSLFYDELHLNELGQRLFADLAADQLRAALPSPGITQGVSKLT